MKSSSKCKNNFTCDFFKLKVKIKFINSVKTIDMYKKFEIINVLTNN